MKFYHGVVHSNQPSFSSESLKSFSLSLSLPFLKITMQFFQILLLGILDISDFTGELYQKVMTMILEQYQKEKKVLPAQIISHFESKEEQFTKLFKSS